MIHRTEAIEGEKAFSLGWKGRLLILMIALVGMGVVFYSQTLRDLLTSVLHREGSSHGLFVPFISGYFLWLKRERIRQVEIDFSPLLGGAMLLASFILLHLSRGSTEVALPALSFLLIVVGLVMVFFGMGIFKELAFPLLFLLTMIPVPETMYGQIAEWMRAATTAGSVWLMELIQHPVFREGYNIQLPKTNLYIAMSCSGIRYLLSYFVFSLAYAFLFKKTVKSRTLVVLAAFPIALIAGVLRLSSIYLATSYIGPFMAGQRPHILLSWSVFLVVLVGAIAADQYLSSLRARRGAHGRME
jgi:exosortase